MAHTNLSLLPLSPLLCSSHTFPLFFFKHAKHMLLTLGSLYLLPRPGLFLPQIVTLFTLSGHVDLS